MARTFSHKIMTWELKLTARKLKERPIKYIPNDCFDDPAMEKTIMADMPRFKEFEEARKQIKPPANASPEIAELYIQPLLDKDQEQHLFRKMNFLKHKASKHLEILDPENPRAALVRRIQHYLDAAAAIKKFIAQSNMRLAWTFAVEKAAAVGHPQITTQNLVSDGYLTLCRAIDLFDYKRGVKFSTYCVSSIKMNYCRSVPEELDKLTRWQTGHDPILDKKLDDNPHEHNPEYNEQRRHAKAIIEDLLRHLSPRRRQTVRDYFGLDGTKYTLDQIGKRFKVGKERARQYKMDGVKRLRELAAEKNLSLEQILCGKRLDS